MVKYMVMDKSNHTVEPCRKYFELRDFCLLVVFVSLLSKMTAPNMDANFFFVFFFVWTPSIPKTRGHMSSQENFPDTVIRNLFWEKPRRSSHQT